MLCGLRWSVSKGQVAGLMLVILGLAGCGTTSDLPKVFPVKGRVIFKDKNLNPRLLAGGCVEFLADTKTSAFGEIKDDGTVVLVSYIKNKIVEGVAPGTYRARIAPPPDGWERGAPNVLTRRFGSFDRSGLQYTVGEGSHNDFTILVE